MVNATFAQCNILSTQQRVQHCLNGPNLLLNKNVLDSACVFILIQSCQCNIYVCFYSVPLAMYWKSGKHQKGKPLLTDEGLMYRTDRASGKKKQQKCTDRRCLCAELTEHLARKCTGNVPTGDAVKEQYPTKIQMAHSLT